MHTRFLLGPAGSGKTFRCLAEIRARLLKSPEGPPLLLLAPKQATFQLERQLLSGSDLAGYTRLRILSFERLAEFILNELHCPPTRLLNDEGRVMVMRALLERKRDELRLFHAAARLPGFAQQLSALLREFQRFHLNPDRLMEMAEKIGPARRLDHKLRDLSRLLRAYRDWLQEHELQDADSLLDLAAEALRAGPRSKVQGPRSAKESRVEGRGSRAGNSSLLTPHSSLVFANLWLDGFAEMTAQEVELLAAMLPYCAHATLAFCLEQEPQDDVPWLSTWSVVSQTYRKCRAALAAVPGIETAVEVLPRDIERSRFAGNPELRHLEENWSRPRPYEHAGSKLDRTAICSLSEPAHPLTPSLSPSGGEGARRAGDGAAPVQLLALRIFPCANPEAEAVLAAREIVRAVRDHGLRYRDIAVLLRSLEGYADVLRRNFTRYDIPFFLDRRESAAHHPLAELTRSAFRTVAFGWRNDDWFGALKTGFTFASDEELDRLENEALARGWSGDFWRRPIQLPDKPAMAEPFEKVRQRIVPPFERLASAFAAMHFKPDGRQLVQAIRELWQDLRVDETLERWSEQTPAPALSHRPGERGRSPGEREITVLASATPVHLTLREQMRGWLENLERAFTREALPLREWLPILEAGLSNLTVGVIPPALDQVLIGTIDRSRNPDLQLVLLPGMNETVFPATPPPGALLSDADLEMLVQHGIDLGLTQQQQLGHERYYGYIACTRARQRLVISYSERNADDAPLNPSPFIDHLQRLFPNLVDDTGSHEHPLTPSSLSPGGGEGVRKMEEAKSHLRSVCREVEHPCEIIAPLLATESLPVMLETLPRFSSLGDEVARLRAYQPGGTLTTAVAEGLYGTVLRTSVSELEQFASCPFKFFVSAGLRARERERFEVDARQRGSFQHEVLARFHAQVHKQRMRWRDLSPDDAAELIGRIASDLTEGFHSGLFHASPGNRFAARSLASTLQTFIRTIIDWMQFYQFDPAQVELSFGRDRALLPAWELDLGHGHLLRFGGIIDRVDVVADSESGDALCVVIDYKSGVKKIDALLLEHGIQIQLPAYLAVLRQLNNPQRVFGARRLVPAGIFYVSLRGKYERGAHRGDVLKGKEEVRRAAFQHQGRFPLNALLRLDAQAPPAGPGSGQFNYRLTKGGKPYKKNAAVMEEAAFLRMLDGVEAKLREMGRDIYAGVARVDPYFKGRETACDFCDYRSICRIDPWTHRYRVLRTGDNAAATED